MISSTLKSTIILNLFLMFFWIVFCQKPEAQTQPLCDDSVIHAADRLPNGTYRVYRGNYFWELKGLPQREAQFEGPYPLPFKGMDIFTPNISVFTLTSGENSGNTVQLNWNNTIKVFKPSGESLVNHEWEDFPKGNYHAGFTDGDLDKKGYELIILFNYDDAYYFTSTGLMNNKKDTFFVHNGTDFQTFPPNLTAAMAFPSNDSKVPYFVYLFREDKYCYRPVNQGKTGCPDWRENKELFGCLRPTTVPPVTETTTNSPVNEESVDGSPTDPVGGNPPDSDDDRPKDSDKSSFDDSDDSSYSSQTDSGSKGGSSWLWVIVVFVFLFLGIAIVVFVCLGSSKGSSKGESSKQSVDAPPPAAAPTAPNSDAKAPATGPEDPDPDLRTPSVRST